MAKKKDTGNGGGADRHKHRLVGLRLSGPVREAAERLARRVRRTLAAMCRLLVEEGLVARGLIEPQGESEDGGA
jgi:hypothetical protein